MKKKLLITMLSTLCIAMSGCNTSTDTSNNNTIVDETSTDSVASTTESDTENVTESTTENDNTAVDSSEENDAEENNSEKNDTENNEKTEEGNANSEESSSDNIEETIELNASNYDAYIPEENKKIRFYLNFNEDADGKFADSGVDFLQDGKVIASYYILEPNVYDTYCFCIDPSLLTGDSFTVQYTTNDPTPLEINYGYDPNSSLVYAVSLGIDENDQAYYGGLGEFADFLGTYVDTYGTTDIYSELIIQRKMSSSYALSASPADVEIGIYRLTTLTGIGIFDYNNNSMTFHCTEEGMNINGEVTFDEFGNSATFTVTESDWDLLPVGEVVEFPTAL